MSFILDALRKSETERQRQSAPGLVDAGYRPPARRRGPWLPILVVVLVANLAVMTYFWLRPVAAPMPAPAAPAAADNASAPVAPESGAQQPADLASDADFAGAANLPAVESEPPAPAESPAPATPAGEKSGSVRDDFPSAEQLMAAGAIPSRPLHLDIHVFSAKPADRFVFINMRKYGEGALLPEGPKIEEITRDGVVLSEAGQRFTLSRD